MHIVYESSQVLRYRRYRTEPQAALVRTWLVDPRYRVAGVDVLRAAAALGPADVQPPPLMLATENPQAAWAAVVACADDH